ncbi:MAG TPA: RluA family pseudouridine synthase, partial [Candidatus Saccharimonadales bacterium]
MSPQESTRLDIALQKQLDPMSRAAVSKLIESGQVKVNSKVILKPSFKVNEADKVSTDYRLENVKIPKIKLPVIYEDEDVAVINKPSGVLAHAKGNFNEEATAATWIEDKYVGPKTNRSGIVHRLDRATSGVMILAKNEPASKWLQKQFSTRKVKKTYIAIVSGHLEYNEAIIDLPIERNPKSPQSFRVGSQGKSAQTE